MAEKEYIEREKAMDAICVFCGSSDGVQCSCADRDMILSIPAADVVEVKHAIWIDNHNGTFTCSVCGGRASKMAWRGRCGAKMDGGENNG